MKTKLFRHFSAGIAVVFTTVIFAASVFGQAANIRIGEKITYNVAIEHLDNAAFAETYIVSTGRVADRDAIEMRTRLKTLNLASAAFFLVDESITTYMSPTTGLPIYSRRDESTTGLPKSTVREYAVGQVAAHDINTLIIAIRNSGQAGSFSLQGEDRIHTVTVQLSGSEAVKSDAGNYETTVLSVQSDYFTERGVSDLRLNLANDESRIPALIRFKTSKGEVKATVASVQVILPEVEPEPSPQPVETPRPAPTPKPAATPEIYINNQPLSTDLPFVLGESLEYRVSSGGVEIGTVIMRAESRTEFEKIDSLLLSATLLPGRTGNSVISPGDFLRTRVFPDSLTPQQFEIRLNSAGNQITQTALFDTRTGMITFGTTPLEAPAGTHSVLSLLYAMRSFNLKPSRDNNNPTNDTRVAVYWDGKATIFFLRPSAPALLEIGEEKIAAQQISVTTNNPQLDALAPKVWLANDARRTPLRITLGAFQLDLVKASVVAPR